VFVDVFNKGKANGDFRNGVRLVIMTALQSPRFLYRAEFGMPAKAGESAVRLDPYETITRLSFLYWGSMPDDALFTLADQVAMQNTTLTKDQIVAQAQRLIASPKARAMAAKFHDLWLEGEKIDTAEKDAKLFPDFNKVIAYAMGTELD